MARRTAAQIYNDRMDRVYRAVRAGTVVTRSEVRTDGHGIPTNIRGAYKPLESNAVVVRLDPDDYSPASVEAFPRNRLRRLHRGETGRLDRGAPSGAQPGSPAQIEYGEMRSKIRAARRRSR